MEKTNHPVEKENNSIQQLILKFVPFWPLFLVTTMVSITYFYFKLKYAVRIYETTASVLIKDEKKGQEDSKMEEVLNVFGTKKIVENELEILRSNSIISEVAIALKLYAAVYEESGWKNLQTSSAYLSSPINIEASNADSIKPTKKIYFTYSKAENAVFIDGTKYALNQWVNSPWGTLKFTNNPYYSLPNQETNTEKVKYYFVLTDIRSITGGIIGSLGVTPASKQSSVINLTYKDPIPQRAENIIAEVVTAYNRAAVERKNQVALKTLKFIEDRLEHVSQELDSLENGIQKYRDRAGAVDLSEQGKLYLENMGTNDRQLNTMNIQLSALEEVEKYVVEKSGEGTIVPSTFNIQDPTLTNLIEKLNATETQYEKLRRTNGENNPTVVSLREEINKTKPSILENIRSQRKSIEAGKSTVEQASGKYYSMLNSIPKKEKDLIEVSRQHNTKKGIYAFLLQKREETSYSISSIIPDCYLVSNPTTSPGPVSPKKSFLAMLALILPITLSAGVVILKDFFNNKILYRTDIEKLTSFPIIGELVQEKLKYRIVTEGSERGFIVEQFRQIRAALKYQGNPPGNTKRILVTSSIKGEGKSFVSTNLAMILARSGKKVALLELDLHQPKISETFDIPECKGISDFLLGKASAEEIVKPTGKHENLFLVPCGYPADEPSELLVNGKLEILLNFLDKQFDVLIIDTAPFKAMTDAFIIASHCNLVLTVIRHNHTPTKLIERLEEDFEAQHITNVAIIFNGVKNRGVGKYSYGYGYGYGYDQKSSYNEYYKKKIKKVS